METKLRFRPSIRQYRILEAANKSLYEMLQSEYRESLMWSRCTLYGIAALYFMQISLVVIKEYYGL